MNALDSFFLRNACHIRVVVASPRFQRNSLEALLAFFSGKNSRLWLIAVRALFSHLFFTSPSRPASHSNQLPSPSQVKVTRSALLLRARRPFLCFLALAQFLCACPSLNNAWTQDSLSGLLILWRLYRFASDGTLRPTTLRGSERIILLHLLRFWLRIICTLLDNSLSSPCFD